MSSCSAGLSKTRCIVTAAKNLYFATFPSAFCHAPTCPHTCEFSGVGNQVCPALQSGCCVFAGGTRPVVENAPVLIDYVRWAEVPPQWTHAKAAADIALAFNPEHARNSPSLILYTAPQRLARLSQG